MNRQDHQGFCYTGPSRLRTMRGVLAKGVGLPPSEAGLAQTAPEGTENRQSS
jgi:hypothetical protein